MTLTTIVALLFLSAIGFAQTADELSETANQLIQDESWSEAAATLSKLVELQPESPQTWFQLAGSLHRSGRPLEAVKAYEKVLAIDSATPFHPFAKFRGAESFAAAGNEAKAVEWLAEAVDLGFAPPNLIENSDALKPLRERPEYAAAIEGAKKNATPCEYTAEHRQFDFWIGDWDVFTPGGQQAGTNTIEKIVEGCVIYENWTSATGVVGKSFNFYDATDEKWHQLWVDAQGNVLRMSGTYQDGVLDYVGETKNDDGSTRKERLRFYDLDNGYVRQLWEQSSDDGKTWTVAFDGEYRPKE